MGTHTSTSIFDELLGVFFEKHYSLVKELSSGKMLKFCRFLYLRIPEFILELGTQSVFARITLLEPS